MGNAIFAIMKTPSNAALAMSKRIGSGIALLAALATLVACGSTNRDTRESAGRGAAAGAVIGGVVGHQSGETMEGAGIGAAAGAAIGAAAEELGNDDEPIGGGVAVADPDDPRIEYGDLMTQEEKDRVLARSGERFISDWGDHLTEEEKRRLLRRADS